MIEGRVRAAAREADAKVSLAWHVERFAREDPLKPLAEYLTKEPTVRRSSADLLAGFEALRANGFNVTIEKVGG